jgi:hypothetical protein
MMKKVLFSILFLFGFFMSAMAQNPLELYHEGELLPDTIGFWWDDNPDYELVFEANVKNNTEGVLRVGLIRKNIDTVPGTENYFCWAGACLPANMDTSSTNYVLPAGQTTENGAFSAHYIANEKKGITIIKYTFYDLGDPDINASVVVKYAYSAAEGVNDNTFNNVSFSNAYPNPATNMVNIDYNLNNNASSASVKVINLLGSVVKSANLSVGSNKVSFDVSDLTQGVYFYSIIVDGNIHQTKKLIIK